MATNQNNHLIDDAGNVVVDFVWGNIPMQPNDVRRDNGGSNLDYTLDSHNIVEDGWNGYPLYTPNDPGTQSGGVDYVSVPNVVGQLTADAQDTLTDSELTYSTASAVTPAISNVVLSSNSATITTSAAHGYAAGDVVTIASLADNGSDHYSDLNGTHTITGTPLATTFTFAQTHANLPSLARTGTAKVAARAGTIKTQSVAAGTSVAVGTSVTITPYFAS